MYIFITILLYVFKKYLVSDENWRERTIEGENTEI